MTLGQAIEFAGNGGRSKDVILWVSRLDGNVKRQIFDSHEGPVCSFAGYTEQTPLDTELLVPEPFAEIYEHHISAEIARRNMQQEEHNCAIVLFNQVWAEFRNDYNRRYMPKQPQFIY